MRIICGKSGIEFTCEFFPGFNRTGNYHHPVFSLSPHQLLSYAGKWIAGELTQTDSYLLFVAGLDSTGLLEWRCPIKTTDATASIVAQNMNKLFNVLGKLDVIKHPSFAVPRFCISHETNNLANVKHWLECWLEAYDNFKNGYQSISLNQKIARREAALERLIKNKQRTVQSYSSLLADWAALAGAFPEFAVNIDGAALTCRDYWKQLISKCSNKDALWKINAADLQELIEHCEENIDHGSIYSHTLMKYLRTAYAEITNPLGYGAPLSTKFEILEDDNADVANANLQAIIANAPSVMPQEKDYPTKFLWLKAKMAYQLAQKSKSQAQQAQAQAKDSNYDL